LRGVPCEAGVVKSCSGDVTVCKALFLTSATSCSDHYHLLIAHTLGRFEPVNPGVAEVRCENSTAFGQPIPWDDKQQDPAGHKPAVRVAQERLLGAATVSRPQCSIIGWIQIQEAKALDRALHFQRISLDDVGNSLPGLLSVVGIKLDTVAEYLGTAGDRLEGHAIANAGVDCGGWSMWKLDESANPQGFG